MRMLYPWLCRWGSEHLHPGEWEDWVWQGAPGPPMHRLCFVMKKNPTVRPARASALGQAEARGQLAVARQRPRRTGSANREGTTWALAALTLCLPPKDCVFLHLRSIFFFLMGNNLRISCKKTGLLSGNSN